ncbi:MAG: D-aminoacyl-tRNA deacylase [Thermosphaera sp.]
MYGLAYSINDPAGAGIARALRDKMGLSESSVCKNSITCFQGGNIVLAGFREDVIYFDFLDDRMPPEVIIYIILSRHSSEARVKSYTVHHTGNFGGNALYGGNPGELGISSPMVSWLLLRALHDSWRNSNRAEYEVSYEATHHGPTSLSKPLVFVEIGSSVNEWGDLTNHFIVASSIVKPLESPQANCEPVIGIGGGHYPRKHTEIALKENVCYGHIIPKYALQHLSQEILDKMISRSDIDVRGIIVEKKGTRIEHRSLIEDYASRRGIEVRYV